MTLQSTDRFVKNIPLQLTAEELEDCTEDGNLVNGLKFVPKRGGSKDKTSYVDMLRPKLLNAVDRRSPKFTFPDKPMESGTKNVVIYTRCGHNNKRSGIFMKKSEVVIGNPLSLVFANECRICAGPDHENPNVAMNENFEERTQFDALISIITNDISTLTQKMKMECMNSDYPMKKFNEVYPKYGIEANRVFIKAAQENQALSRTIYDAPSLSLPTTTTIVDHQHMLLPSNSSEVLPLSLPTTTTIVDDHQHMLLPSTSSEVLQLALPTTTTIVDDHQHMLLPSTSSEVLQLSLPTTTTIVDDHQHMLLPSTSSEVVQLALPTTTTIVDDHQHMLLPSTSSEVLQLSLPTTTTIVDDHQHMLLPSTSSEVVQLALPTTTTIVDDHQHMLLPSTSSEVLPLALPTTSTSDAQNLASLVSDTDATRPIPLHSSAGFMQLTNFTNALKAPVLILSSSGAGTQKLTHLITPENELEMPMNQEVIIEKIPTPKSLVRINQQSPITPTTPPYHTRTLRSAERAAIVAANTASSQHSLTPQKSRKRTPRLLLAIHQQEENLQKKSRAI